MAKAFKWLFRILVGLLVLAAIAVGLVWLLAAGSLPDYDARRSVPGLTAPVEIVRDIHAVPHILASTAADGYFGLGYAHAEDRLWQMEVLRRTAQGRLSELFGPQSFEVDRLMRSLDLYPIAVETARRQNPETLAALEAYAAGVNARLTVVAREALGRGAPEFLLFTNQLSPWTPADSVAIGKLMALQLTGQAARETQRAALALVLPPERLADIRPDAPEAAVIALPRFASLFPGAVFPERVQVAAQPPAFSPLAEPGFAGASNAFAADGTRTATGLPVLATDPHLGLTAPAIWMPARIRFPDVDVIGGSIPGLPGILIGRNADFGWGLTAAQIDDQDVYIEQVDPDDPTRYRTPAGWEAFRSRDVLIGVAGEVARTVTLRWTRHGPVIPPGVFGAAEVTPKGHVAALAWTALSVEDRSIEAGLRLMRATTLAEGREAARLLTAPGQNIMMADRTGIALQVAGAVPLRKLTHQGQGRLPVPGWVAENDWAGLMPFDTLPNVERPEGGILVNTNNRTTDAAFPQHLTFDWGDSQRIRRATRLLKGREFHSRESFVEIQTDIVSETARALLPLMARDLWWAGQPAADDSQGRFRQAALQRLADWNGEMDQHAPEPLIYAAWIRNLTRRIVLDELGPLTEKVTATEPVFLERVFRDIDGAGVWCDITKTVGVETCAEMARLALDDALAELTAGHGTRIESWRWGDAHQAVQKHRVLGDIFPFSLFVNIIEPSSGGDFTLMRGLMANSGPEPYANVHASGFRAVYDFSDPNGSVFIVSTGVSGHPLSRHYDDQSSFWRRGEYIRMTLDIDDARGGAIGITKLVPETP